MQIAILQNLAARAAARQKRAAAERLELRGWLAVVLLWVGSEIQELVECQIFASLPGAPRFLLA